MGAWECPSWSESNGEVGVADLDLGRGPTNPLGKGAITGVKKPPMKPALHCKPTSKYANAPFTFALVGAAETKWCMESQACASRGSCLLSMTTLLPL